MPSQSMSGAICFHACAISNSIRCAPEWSRGRDSMRGRVFAQMQSVIAIRSLRLTPITVPWEEAPSCAKPPTGRCSKAEGPDAAAAAHIDDRIRLVRV